MGAGDDHGEDGGDGDEMVLTRVPVMSMAKTEMMATRWCEKGAGDGHGEEGDDGDEMVTTRVPGDDCGED
ncbi:MAG: hypothetical protein LBT40_06735 [Deltaproteobacteria bacterium]|jgi:hypothetical protein|nr:hypothetical protein [Deltaproteobacteria bacterium]